MRRVAPLSAQRGSSFRRVEGSCPLKPEISSVASESARLWRGLLRGGPSSRLRSPADIHFRVPIRLIAHPAAPKGSTAAPIRHLATRYTERSCRLNPLLPMLLLYKVSLLLAGFALCRSFGAIVNAVDGLRLLLSASGVNNGRIFCLRSRTTIPHSGE